MITMNMILSDAYRDGLRSYVFSHLLSEFFLPAGSDHTRDSTELSADIQLHVTDYRLTRVP